MELSPPSSSGLGTDHCASSPRVLDADSVPGDLVVIRKIIVLLRSSDDYHNNVIKSKDMLKLNDDTLALVVGRVDDGAHVLLADHGVWWVPRCRRDSLIPF